MALAVLLLVGASCGFSKGGVTATGHGASSDSSAGGPIAGGTGEGVTLLSAGHGAKSKLRYRLHKGDRQISRLLIRLHLRQTISGRNNPMDTPPIYEDISSEVTDASATASTVKYTLIDAGLASDTGSSDSSSSSDSSGLYPAARDLKGIGGTYTINDRGELLHGSLNIPKNVSASVRQSLTQLREELGQLSKPLPAEPVGLGARWTVDAPVTFNGISVRQQSTFELTEHHGNRYRVKVTGRQTAKHGPATLSGSSGSQEVQITGWDLRLSGTSETDLSRPFPIHIEFTTVGDQSFKVKTDSKVAGLSQSLSLRFTVDAH